MDSRVLAPLDGSTTARLVLDHAAHLFDMSGSTIVLLNIIEEMKHSNDFEHPMVYIQEVRHRFLAAGQALLDETAAGLKLKYSRRSSSVNQGKS